MRRTRLCLPVLLLGLAAGTVAAADPIVIEIKDQGFVPREISVPAGVKVELQVRNDDALPAEFESYDLSREIVVPAHGQVKVFIGPLDPGRYRFFNDFHQESEGWVVVAAAGK
jgi:Cupredoxin-like domain